MGGHGISQPFAWGLWLCLHATGMRCRKRSELLCDTGGYSARLERHGFNVKRISLIPREPLPESAWKAGYARFAAGDEGLPRNYETSRTRDCGAACACTARRDGA